MAANRRSCDDPSIRREVSMDMDRILSTLLSNPARAGLAAAVAGGLLTSKGGRKLGKRAIEFGGMAALAGLAYSAWQRHQQGERAGSERLEPTPGRLRSAGFLPEGAAASEDFGRALFRAMVAAARADGRLDAGERSSLLEQIVRLGSADGERAELYAEIEQPVTIDEVVASAKTPQQAAELYAASLCAAGTDTPAERGYLALLAARLGLDDGLVAAMHGELEAGSEPAPSPAPRTKPA
jgi:uncharacterized membrane protein YebE (DUF533 family)